MLDGRMNQTILITGESGSGKTENTCRVIQYLTKTASAHHGSTLMDPSAQSSLEDQILQANPILEAFGNAKTVRNNNSSRFGKFVRLQFNGSSGWINGANFEHYLLEKGRVTHHHRQERSFHIFYQMLAGSSPEMRQKYHLMPASQYLYLNSGVLAIDGVSDGRVFEETVRAMQTVGFSAADLDSIWRLLSAILLLGNIRFRNEGDYAQFEGEESQQSVDLICNLLGMDAERFSDSLLRPTLQAGDQTVTTLVSAAKATSAANALAKGVYERLFRWLVQRINSSLATARQPTSPIGRTKSNFIGVLDIAGFEIFEVCSANNLSD
jgi:myosin protein heavy chain